MFKRKICLFFICLCFNLANYAVKETSPTLTIKGLQTTKIHTSNQLLNMKNVVLITMDYNRAYPGVKMTYKAIKLCELLKPFHTQPDEIFEFIAADKFAVLIPAKKLMDCGPNASIAYLAIEPKEKWPVLPNGTHSTAGPFTVIWENPEKSYISDEYWAWSVVEITAHDKLDPKQFAVLPDLQNEPENIRERLKNGHEKYISHCAACHSINGVGKGVIGPDLNIPLNPVEYYPDDNKLKKFIRDPQSVRKLKHDRMSGSSVKSLSDKDLDDLILYFHFMVKHKGR